MISCRSSRVRKLFATLPLIGTLAVPVTVDAALEEVMVTATRRAETDIQTTPVSVTAITGDSFDALFAQDIGEIATFVPNFSAATVTGFNAASFAMRGAAETDIIVYFDPKVGVLVDDFVVPHVQTQLLEPFDIETVEVLRGPQGTLFGKNTTAGAVVVKTKRPDLEQRYAEGSVQYGRFDDIKAKFALNLPISDTFAFRFAGIYQSSDGYYENGKVDTPMFGASGDALAASGTTIRGDGRNLGGKDVFSGRAKLLWEPTENISILGQYEIIRDSSDPVPVVNTTPNNAGQLATLFGFPGIEGGDPIEQAGIHQSTIVGLNGDQRVDVDGGYLNVEWDLGNHTFYAVGGYRYQESRLPSEYLGTPYESFFAASRDDDRETLQIEGRLASEHEGPFNYVLGVFYQENDTEFCVLQQLGLLEFFGAAVPGILDNDNPLVICNRQDASAWAVFGDLSYEITDRVTVSFGARWTHEEKDFIGRVGTPIALLGLTLQTLGEPLTAADFDRFPAGVSTDSETWEKPTWRGTLSFELTDNHFVYGTLSRGFKSGGYNDQAGSGGPFFPVEAYDPEFATSLEFGFKGSFFDDTVRFNSTFFQVKYDDFQRSTVVQIPGTAFQETRTFNAAQVTARGIETELTWLITENLTLRGNVGWLDATYDEFLLDRDANPLTPPTDLSDRTVVRAPEVTGGIDLTYMQSLSFGTIRYNVNFNYEAPNVYYYNDDLGSQFDTILEERTIVNLSATWTDPTERYWLSAFGKNLTDDRYQTAAQAVGILWTFSNYGPPITYGVEAGMHFDF